MKKIAYINDKINRYNQKIYVPGDKSLSIRFVLIASQAIGKSIAFNLLKSEDVINALNAIKKLGINYKLKKNFCEINGKGLNGFKFKNNTIINAGNSGTLARLLIGLLSTTPDVELRIPGLVCSSCAIGVKNGFSKTKLVKNIKFDTKKQICQIEFISVQIHPSNMTNIVKKAGYELKSIKWLKDRKPNRYNAP